MILRAILLALLVAQQPHFELASIRLHTGELTVSGGINISGPRITIPASTLAGLITSAYDLHDYQLEGVTDWMQTDRYDIAAEAATQPTDAEAKKMLRALLTDRFHLTLHQETKPKSVYALTVTKSGSRLKENSAGPGIVKYNRKGREVEMVFRGATIDSLIRQLPRMPGIDRPVLDETRLTGKYDFNLTLADVQLTVRSEPNAIPAEDAPGATIFTALQDQLGLKLESRRAPIATYRIDRAEQPSAN